MENAILIFGFVSSILGAFLLHWWLNNIKLKKLARKHHITINGNQYNYVVANYSIDYSYDDIRTDFYKEVNGDLKYAFQVWLDINNYDSDKEMDGIIKREEEKYRRILEIPKAI